MIMSLRILLAIVLYTITCVSSTDEWNSTETRALFQRRSISDGVNLRILPLGDSITWGAGSSDGNSYRWRLMNLLVENRVTYIGSQRSGTMVNNNNEGHSGAVIAEIERFSEYSLHLRPNIVLVLAGTNDINKPSDPAGAPDRLGSLIDKIIAAYPDAAILVGQIPPIEDTDKNAAAQTYNAAIPEVVAARANAGSKVLTVDMYTPLDVAKDLGDKLHPNDRGYSLMASIWYSGIQQAAERGWIGEPIPSPIGNHNHTCTTFLTWDPKFGTIATGVGSGDAPFVSGWQPAGELATGNVGFNNWLPFFVSQGAGVRLADMNGDGRDDYLWVHPLTGALTLYLNGGYSADGGVNWIFKGQVATGVGDGPGVMFADINGDGRDDYLWVASTGEVTAYLNGGEQAGGGWLWTPLGQIASGGPGATRATTRFADIDGDGRADYFVVGPQGSLNGWLNLGLSDRPDWYPMGIIADGIGDAAGVFLYDLNNDGLADYIWLAKDGAATVYINNRGPSRGLAPTWVNAGIIATGVGSPPDEIIFGDLNGDGKKDYVQVDPGTGALKVWLNTGRGGTYVVGDGTRFADMDGDGFDDYLAITPNGAIQLWLNHGYDTSSQKWIWEAQGQIATGVSARKNIRVADLDGDGLADYLVVDEKSGAVVFWHNGGKQADGSWSWTNMGQVATGVGAGIGVQFADIDGDGKADYLWVAEDGAVTAFLNGGSSSSGWIWTSQGVIATGVGAARQDIKFADLNGDGLADYLWVNRLDGSVSEWQNAGTKGNWQWAPQGQIATGVGSNGLSIQFAVLNGKGRADYLNVAPSSGAVTQWANECFGESSGGTEWLTAQCTDPALVDSSISPDVRWNTVDTQNAWVAAVTNWKSKFSSGGHRFPQEVSSFFHGPSQLRCGEVADHTGCEQNVVCNSVNHPAGMFILNSFIQIHQMNMNFYDAIFRAEADLSALMGGFSSTFAPIKKKPDITKLILDFASLGYGLLAAPVWNVALKQLDYFGANPNNAATLKDETNNLVSSAMAIAKDSSLGGVTLNVNDSLESAMANLIKYWVETTAAVNGKIFDGSADSIEQLTRLIADGRVIGVITVPDDRDIQTYIKKAIYAWLIPNAWSLSNEGFHPFILDSGERCTGGNPLPKYLSDETAEKTSVCYNEHVYYFVSASGKHRTCSTGPGGIVICVANKFTALPGMKALDDGTYGEVTKADLVAGALAGYHANGNKNGWPTADPGQQMTVSDLYDTGIHSPGVVMIPICDPELVILNWSSGDTTAPGYPCQV